jgi:hypothetical protein
MTAEVALLNKHAVALAADSAVTMTSAKGQKIYNAANKVFALSRRHPVGVMIYGSAEFMGVPWETIIKLYRSRLADRAYDTIDQYFAAFLEFLGTEDGLFGQDPQLDYVERRTLLLSLFARDAIRKKVGEYIQHSESDGIDEAGTAEVVTKTLAYRLEQCQRRPYAPGFSEQDEKAILAAYNEPIAKSIDVVFQQLPLTEADREALHHYAACALTRDRLAAGYSGIVVAGFGDMEHFPVLRRATD